METINDIVFNIAKYPSILANVILEETNQINQTIKDNITQLNLFPLEYSEYFTGFIISFIITFSLMTITGLAFFYRNFKTSTEINNKINTKISNSKTVKNTIHPILKGLYLESVAEVNAASANINKKLEKGQTNWVLLRVQMSDYLNMAGTMFELHGNNIHADTHNTKEAFQTKDVYLILKFRIIGEIKQDSQVGNQIIHVMNELNHSGYITNDFIICAIGTSTNVAADEFNTGLKHIGYELENNLQINKKIPGTNMIINYNLLLPIHQVYDVFMDVYNNCIFESTKYVIDNDNYESWNGKSINELVF